MAERRILWGPTPTDAQYRTGDTEGDTNFVVAEDTDAGTVLLEWDDTANEWVSRGPVNMSGNDITNAGAITSDSVSTGGVVNNQYSDVITDDDGGNADITKNGLTYYIEAAGPNDNLLVELNGSYAYHIRSTITGDTNDADDSVYYEAYYNPDLQDIYVVHDVENASNQSIDLEVVSGNLQIRTNDAMATSPIMAIWATVG